jgi:hypothetical protein
LAPEVLAADDPRSARLFSRPGGKMRSFLVVFLFVFSVFVLNPAAFASPQSSCGQSDVHFEIKKDSGEHVAQAEAGQALVYIIQDEDHPDCLKCDVTTRVGLDGSWIGANSGDSYFFFSVDPGEHHLCANRQPEIGVSTKPIALLGFMAEARKTYYFRVHAIYGADRGASYSDFAPVDPDEAQYLISISAYATSRSKK